MTTAIIYDGHDSWTSQSVPNENNDEVRALKVDSSSGSQKFAYLWFKLPFNPGQDVDVASATFYFTLKTPVLGSRVFLVRRINAKWSSVNLSYNNAPPVDSGSSAQVTVSGGNAGDEYAIDVTNLLSPVGTDQQDWYGFRLGVTTAGPFQIWSKDATNPDFRPRMEFTWTETPDKPTDLIPSGNQVISVSQPNLGWHNPGWHGETTQQQAEVVIYSDGNGNNVVWDSGMIPWTKTEMDLSQMPGAPSIGNGVSRWWQVKYIDSQGRKSQFSPLAKFTRQTKGNLAVNSPTDGSVVQDVTPVVLIQFSSGTLDSFSVHLEKFFQVHHWGWKQIWYKPRKPAGSNTPFVVIPKGYIRRTDDSYRLRVRAWDTFNRADRPGDRPFVEAIVNFTFDQDPAINKITSMTVTQHADRSPIVDINIVDGSAPDYYSLIVDGDRKYPRFDPIEANTGVGTYTISYTDAEPFVSTDYEVERVIAVTGNLHHSQARPPVSYASQPNGIWLYDPNDIDNDVRLAGGDQHGGDFDWGETAAIYFPAGGRWPQPPVRIIQSTRGREGTVSGVARDNGSVKARFYIQRLRAIWRTGSRMRLVVGEVNIPVVIGEPHDSPLYSEKALAYQVSFAVWQVDDFDR